MCEFFDQVPANTSLQAIADEQASPDYEISLAKVCPTTELLGSCTLTVPEKQVTFTTYLYSMDPNTDLETKTTYESDCKADGGTWK